MPDMDPYSTAKPFLSGLPSWIADVEEQRRVASYALYEMMYWNVPETFKLVSRGMEDSPIYIPSSRIIVETMHRFLAPKMDVIADPKYGTPADQLIATQVIEDFMRRERVKSKFNANKRYGLIRGDWAFQIYADPSRVETTRLSLLPVDPGSIFPIYNPNNIDEIIGYHIAEQFLDNDGKVLTRRLTYRKATGVGGPSPITVEDAIFEANAWGGPGMAEEDIKLIQQVMPLTTLPAPIEQLPIYMIPNFETPGTIFGSSEMRGLENLIAKINQSISDEDMALALEGLGVYVTDAGTPVDDDGEEVPWNLGPGRVVEIPTGKKFDRVGGSSSMAPYQEHIALLRNVMDESAALSAVAKGKVDVTVAESGIALALELAPLIARADEKEITITDRLTNMFYDLAKWFVAYEGSAFNTLVENTRWIPIYGEKLPPNKKQDLADLLSIAKATPQLVPTSYIRARMRAIGYTDLPDDATIEAEILAEAEGRARVKQDAFGAGLDRQINSELGSIDGTEEA
jgi:hypothetical protein